MQTRFLNINAAAVANIAFYIANVAAQSHPPNQPIRLYALFYSCCLLSTYTVTLFAPAPNFQSTRNSSLVTVFVNSPKYNYIGAVMWETH